MILIPLLFLCLSVSLFVMCDNLIEDNMHGKNGPKIQLDVAFSMIKLS